MSDFICRLIGSNLRAAVVLGPENGRHRPATEAPEPVLEARGVCAGYPGRAVLEDVSLALRPGEILSVIGPNGAGKSTLLRVLAGTLEPSAGDVRLFGRSLRSQARREIARRLSVVPQESEVAFGFSVEQVVMMGRAPHQTGLLLASDADRQAVERAIERVELGALRDRPVAELSGGERRRVVIARALAQAGDVLLLDEPAAHLDLRHAVQLYATARAEVEQRGVGCVAVMHDLAAAARWTDRALLLVEGRVAAIGSVDEVLSEERLEQAFGVRVRVGVDPLEKNRYFLALPR